MRIVINGMFWQEPHVGSGRYVHNLLQQFATLDHSDKLVLVLPRYTAPLRPHLPGIQTVIMPTPFDRHNHHLAKLWFEHVALLQVAHKVRAECIHVPYFGPPRHSRIPTVVSILDLIPLLLPAYRGGRLVRGYMRLAAAGAQRAHAVIAISQHGRTDIVEHLGIPEARIRVTYLAAEAGYQPQPPELVTAVRERFHVSDRYIYYVGGFDLRKNVPLLIRAFARLIKSGTEPLQLVIAGRPPGSDPQLFPDINKVILDCGIAGYVNQLGPVTDSENAALMTGCAAFAFPSTYEGFGLTPLEALCCRAPVVAASTTSVGEVVADGGLLVDPADEDSWVDALRRVTGEAATADELRERGRERAQRFNWRDTAAQTLELYHAMV